MTAQSLNQVEWMPTAQMATMLGVSTDTLKTWRLGNRRGKLPCLKESIHWVYVGPNRVNFNVALMRDFMVNRNRPELHQQAILAYLASLPSSQAVS